MVAYNFMAQFIEPIRLGLKNHTIRPDRKRHARIAELVHLQHGSRFRPVRFGVSVCRYVNPIRLDFVDRRIEVDIAGLAMHPALDELMGSGWDAFARADGFESWDQMAAFWHRTHNTTSFAGVIVGWVPLPETLNV